VLLLAWGARATPKEEPEWKSGTAAIGFFSQLVDMWHRHIILPVQGHRLEDELGNFGDELRNMRELKQKIRVQVVGGNIPDNIGGQLEGAVYHAQQSFKEVRRFFFTEVQSDGNAVGDDLFRGLSYKEHLAQKISAQVVKHDTVAIEDELKCGEAVLTNLAECIDKFHDEVSGRHVDSLGVCKRATATDPPPECMDTGSVSVKSTPNSALVSADGNEVDKTPANLKLAPGKHTIKVSATGYKDWTREVTVHAGSDTALNAILAKQ